MKPSVRRSVDIDTPWGKATFSSFHHLSDPREHVAISFSPASSHDTPLVRIHSECLTGDVFGSARCDCGDQLHDSLASMAKVGGHLLYMRQEGRDIGLYNKLDAYALQDQGHDTFCANRLLGLEEDARSYEAAAQMLQAMQVKQIKLITNNPRKQKELADFGIDIVELIATKVFLKKQNVHYLKAKQKSGHTLSIADLDI